MKSARFNEFLPFFYTYLVATPQFEGFCEVELRSTWKCCYVFYISGQLNNEASTQTTFFISYAD